MTLGSVLGYWLREVSAALLFCVFCCWVVLTGNWIMLADKIFFLVFRTNSSV